MIDAWNYNTYSSYNSSMGDVALQGAWLLHFIQNEDDEALPLLGFQRYVVNVIFLKYSKEG